jgi:signal transduction histidine kinase
LRIEQVMVNLIDNALKFSPEGSPVQVSVTEVGPGRDGLADGRSGEPAVGGSQPNGSVARAGRVRITVADRGPGVAPEDRPHLFDRFFRSHSTAYTSGMGLGLHICREIVDLHGGTVRADFPPEGGMRVVVELEAGRPDAARDLLAGP